MRSCNSWPAVESLPDWSCVIYSRSYPSGRGQDVFLLWRSFHGWWILSGDKMMEIWVLYFKENYNSNAAACQDAERIEYQIDNLLTYSILICEDYTMNNSLSDILSREVSMCWVHGGKSKRIQRCQSKHATSTWAEIPAPLVLQWAQHPFSALVSLPVHTWPCTHLPFISDSQKVNNEPECRFVCSSRQAGKSKPPCLLSRVCMRCYC